ncbi:MAG: ABC transporter permease, partial [Mucilaginibacter sp.]
MIKNYIKTTLRSLLKNRSYSFLNITGLAIGITCASLIFLWVQDELTFNHRFEKRDQIYRIYENQTYDGKISTFHATPGPMAKAMIGDIPGIKNAARMGGTSAQLFALGEKSINEQGDYADKEILSMLNMPFIHGNSANALQQIHSVVINETMARKFFGDTDPTGKTLRMNNEQDFTVSGVFKDLPKNSTFQFQWLAPMENIDHKQPWMDIWGANWAHTYVELEP